MCTSSQLFKKKISKSDGEARVPGGLTGEYCLVMCCSSLNVEVTKGPMIKVTKKLFIGSLLRCKE
jgi:hypothetical protein